jgi:hypothetical protein
VAEQLLGAGDAEMGDISVRRHPDLRSERAAQVELVELGVPAVGALLGGGGGEILLGAHG